MDLQNFRFEIDGDGIGLLTWDMPGRSMNVITTQVMDELESVIDKVAAEPAIKGAVITSGKETFSGGADLAMLEAARRDYARRAEAEGEAQAMASFFAGIRRLSVLYRKLETCGKPWAAAINGLCVGGAFELALACHYRVMADVDSARVGLPEIRVGLFPGAGGTQRIARLMPTPDALQMLLKGEQIGAKAAKARGLVHLLAPAGEIVGKAKEWIKAGGKAVAPWDEPNFRLPSGRVHSAAGMMIWPAANAIYRRETYDNYPAARALLQAVYDGLQLPIDLALEVESRAFIHVLASKEAGAMIRSLFVSLGALNKGARRPAGIAPSVPKKIGILGAGFMGASIAYVSARAGFDVVLIDRDQASADKGKAVSAKNIGDEIMKGRAKSAERDALLGADRGDTGLCETRRLRPRHRGRLRGSAGEGGGDTQGCGGGRRDDDPRLQHVDPADHLARHLCGAPRAIRRHPFLFAGRPDDARRTDPRQGDRRCGARQSLRLRAGAAQDTDRRQRFARLLRQSLCRQLSA